MLTPEETANAHAAIGDHFRKQDAKELGLPEDASYDDVTIAKVRRDIEERREDVRSDLAISLQLPGDAAWEQIAEAFGNTYPQWRPRK